MSANHDELTDKLSDLQALAVQEQFLAEWSAGRRPRLSVYASRYPAYAAALVELVASLPPDGAAEVTTDVAATPTPMIPSPGRFATDAGVARALSAIARDVAPSQPMRTLERPLRHVAETVVNYHAADEPAKRQPPEAPERD